MDAGGYYSFIPDKEKSNSNIFRKRVNVCNFLTAKMKCKTTYTATDSILWGRLAFCRGLRFVNNTIKLHFPGIIAASVNAKEGRKFRASQG